MAGRTRASATLDFQKPAPAGPSPDAGSGPRVRLGDALYRQIFDRIVSGGLNLGDRLPSEHEISRQFGVSRPVVREALQRLRADGLVSAQQGRGTFVSSQPAPRLAALPGAENVAAYLRFQEVRLSLEGDAARLAALRRTDAQMAAIEQAQRAFADAMHRGRADTSAQDRGFHRSVAEASGNDLFLELLDGTQGSLQGFMRLSLHLTRTTASPDRIRRVLDEHQAIVDAVRARDGDRARTAMQFHLDQARQRMVDRDRDR